MPSASRVASQDVSNGESLNHTITALLFKLRVRVGGSAPTRARSRPRSARPLCERRRYGKKKKQRRATRRATLRGASHRPPRRKAAAACDDFKKGGYLVQGQSMSFGYMRIST
jgi:hypothetical protein